MKLNISNPDSNNYCEAVNISPDRQKELVECLDAMVRRLDKGSPKLFKMHLVFAEIVSICKNEAEIVYCTVLHCGLHARRGRILAPGPLDYGVIGLGIQMLYDRMKKEFTKSAREIMGMLAANMDEQQMQEGARRGVQYLLHLKEVELANDIINKLNGFAF